MTGSRVWVATTTNIDNGNDNNIGDVDNEFKVGNGDEDKSNFNDE